MIYDRFCVDDAENFNAVSDRFCVGIFRGNSGLQKETSKKHHPFLMPLTADGS